MHLNHLPPSLFYHEVLFKQPVNFLWGIGVLMDMFGQCRIMKILLVFGCSCGFSCGLWVLVCQVLLVTVVGPWLPHAQVRPQSLWAQGLSPLALHRICTEQLLSFCSEGNCYLSALICTTSDPMRSRSFSPVLLLGPLLPPCPPQQPPFCFWLQGLSPSLSSAWSALPCASGTCASAGTWPKLSHIFPSLSRTPRSCVPYRCSYCNLNSMDRRCLSVHFSALSVPARVTAGMWTGVSVLTLEWQVSGRFLL